MKNASRMFAAAVKTAIEKMGADPATMAAVDKLASGFSSIDAMLNYLWNYSDGFGLNGDFIGKSEAIVKVTGKPFAYWASLHEDRKWFCGSGYYLHGVFYPMGGGEQQKD